MGILKLQLCHVWWYMSAIPAIGRLRQKDHKFEASLDYIVRPCHRKENKSIYLFFLFVVFFLFFFSKAFIIRFRKEKKPRIISPQHTSVKPFPATLI
jgi:hypothetical protein